MNVNLGAPYETIIKKIIEKEYAGTQTEVIRQALISYYKLIESEENKLVSKGIVEEMKKIKNGETKTVSYDKAKKKLKWK